MTFLKFTKQTKLKNILALEHTEAFYSDEEVIYVIHKSLQSELFL